MAYCHLPGDRCEREKEREREREKNTSGGGGDTRLTTILTMKEKKKKSFSLSPRVVEKNPAAPACHKAQSENASK